MEKKLKLTEDDLAMGDLYANTIKSSEKYEELTRKIEKHTILDSIKTLVINLAKTKGLEIKQEILDTNHNIEFWKEQYTILGGNLAEFNQVENPTI